ncbi:hypothetical protein ABKN59_011045 [Abortiporus biennis]
MFETNLRYLIVVYRFALPFQYLQRRNEQRANASELLSYRKYPTVHATKSGISLEMSLQSNLDNNATHHLLSHSELDP